MPEATEYAKVVDGVVTQVIVADQAHIDTRSDGPWILTTTKVGPGYTYSSETQEFTAPEPPPEVPPEP